MSTDVTIYNGPQPPEQAPSLFGNIELFENGQRMAKMLASSDLVPSQYRGNLANTVIALELAQRLGASPLAVMQSSYVIHGKPGWSASFVIACLNSSGKFSPIRFDVTGEGDARSCVAWAYDLANKERIEGPAVSIAMAKKEGWYQKKGSKWQTMPDLMLRYRAATMFGRLYAPEILMGMKTTEEIIDSEAMPAKSASVDELNARIMDDRVDNEQVIDAEFQPEDTQQDSDQPQQEKQKKATRSRPAQVKKFHQEIDTIDNSLHLDRWRMKHHKRIVRELPRESDQQAVLDYAEKRYQALVTREKESRNDPPAPAEEDGAGQFVLCPNGEGNVPVDYCNSECGARKGCPAHE